MTGDKEYHLSTAIYYAQRERAGLPPIGQERWDDFYDSGLSEIAEIRHIAKSLIEQFDINSLDDLVHELGIEDSETTPAEAVRELRAEMADAYERGRRDMAKEVFALAEDTVERYHDIAERDLEGKQGAFARGRCTEAKSIAKTIGAIL